MSSVAERLLNVLSATELECIKKIAESLKESNNINSSKLADEVGCTRSMFTTSLRLLEAGGGCLQ